MVVLAKLNNKRMLIGLAICLIFMLALFLSVTGSGQAKGEKEMLYIGGYDVLFAVDPEKREVVAEIPVKGPNRNINWPADGSKLYINSEGRTVVTVVDTKTNTVVDRIPVSTDEYRGYIYGLAVDPKGEKLYTSLMRTKREGTRFKALTPIIQVRDLKTKEVVQEIDVPWGTHTLQFFTSGDKLAVWGRDLYIYDLETDTLELYYPIIDHATEETGYGNYLYFWVRGQDGQNVATAPLARYYPLTGEESENIIMLNLETGELKEIQLSEPVGLFSVTLHPDRKRLIGGMNYLMVADAETGEVQEVIPNVPGSSYGYNISGDGKTIYVSGAGPDLSFYNAETLGLEATIPLSTDTMDVRVVQIKQ